MPRILLDLAAATEIKRRVWLGHAQEDVAEQAKVSLILVSHIAAGRRWHDAPWPDGKTGRLVKSRRKLIDKARREVNRKLAHKEAVKLLAQWDGGSKPKDMSQ